MNPSHPHLTVVPNDAPEGMTRRDAIRWHEGQAAELRGEAVADALARAGELVSLLTDISGPGYKPGVRDLAARLAETITSGVENMANLEGKRT